ncbi:MAG: hypothetical protein E7240_05630 [Lachnospiraceae bacterium]|nr:hypothetical protein [Lachnospiraceae bacterium]
MNLKKWSAFAFTVIAAAFSLTACGGKAKNEVKAAAEEFLTAEVAGDTAKMRSLSTEEATGSREFSVFSADAFENELYESLSIEKEILSEEVQNEMRDVCKVLSDAFVKDYSIRKVKVKKGVGTVEADLTYGFDPAAIQGGGRLFEDVEAFSGTYMEEHQEELMDLYLEEGEDPVYEKMDNDIMPTVLGTLHEIADNLEDVHGMLYLTLEEVDGAWKITGISTEKSR